MIIGWLYKHSYYGHNLIEHTTSSYLFIPVWPLLCVREEDITHRPTQVNISPSLHTSAPLDKHIKSGLIKDLFNTAGFQVPILPTRSKSTAPTSQQGTSSLSATGRSGHQSVEGGGSSKHDGTTTPVRPIIAGGKSEAGTKENVESVTDSQLYFNPGERVFELKI